jgi:hypothetical protein
MGFELGFHVVIVAFIYTRVLIEQAFPTFPTLRPYIFG